MADRQSQEKKLRWPAIGVQSQHWARGNGLYMGLAAVQKARGHSCRCDVGTAAASFDLHFFKPKLGHKQECSRLHVGAKIISGRLVPEGFGGFQCVILVPSLESSGAWWCKFRGKIVHWYQ